MFSGSLSWLQCFFSGIFMIMASQFIIEFDSSALRPTSVFNACECASIRLLFWMASAGALNLLSHIAHYYSPCSIPSVCYLSYLISASYRHQSDIVISYRSEFPSTFLSIVSIRSSSIYRRSDPLSSDCRLTPCPCVVFRASFSWRWRFECFHRYQRDDDSEARPQEGVRSVVWYFILHRKSERNCNRLRNRRRPRPVLNSK